MPLYTSSSSAPGANSVNSSTITDGAIVDADVNATAAIDASKLANGSVSNTEFQYLDGVTSAIQTQINAITASTSPTPTVGGTYNLGLSLSAGTLKMIQAGSGALSSGAAAGYVAVPGNTAGQVFLLKATSANHKFDGKGAADSDFLAGGCTFGTTTAVAWGNDRPFFLYAINTDDTDAGLYFGFSPSPTLIKTPAAGTGIGYADHPPATAADTNLIFMTTTDPTALTSKPCVCVGSFRAQKDTSDDWTFTALTTQDGIGRFQESAIFIMPVSQNGAGSGKYLSDNSNAAPVFTTNLFEYRLLRNGFCWVNVLFNGDGGTDGSGSVDTSLLMPYKCTSPTTAQSLAHYYIRTPTYEQGNAWAFFTDNSYEMDLRYQSLVGATTKVALADFSNGVRSIQGSCWYPAFA